MLKNLKRKVVSVNAMKTVGRGGTDPLILKFCARWRWVLSITLRPILPGKETRHPLCVCVCVHLQHGIIRFIRDPHSTKTVLS